MTTDLVNSHRNTARNRTRYTTLGFNERDLINCTVLSSRRRAARQLSNTKFRFARCQNESATVQGLNQNQCNICYLR